MATVSEAASRGSARPSWKLGFGADCWAEFFGTFIIICFGDGSVAMLWGLWGSGRSTAGPLSSSGDWLLITWGWALAVAFAVYVTGGISGAHLNPAVTLGFAMRKQFPWNRVVQFWIAQVAGAFVGAALVYLVYHAAINDWDTHYHIVKGTAASVGTYSTFATFPAAYFHTVWGPLIDQIVGTFFLLLFIFALTDDFNTNKALMGMAPFLIGMVIMAIGISFGANAGYAINPARDLGPRLWAWLAGWGKVAMPGNYGNINDYLWIPIVGPLIGGGLAALVYDNGVGNIMRARFTPKTDTSEANERREEGVGPQQIGPKD
jgi:glycerol uptake facilitator protein